MSNLVLELRQGEVMIVNGAPIRFRTTIAYRAYGEGSFLVRQADHGARAGRNASKAHLLCSCSQLISETSWSARAALEAARHFIAEFQVATTVDPLCGFCWTRHWLRPRKTIATRRAEACSARDPGPRTRFSAKSQTSPCQ